MREFASIFAGLLLVCLAGTQAMGENRVALVIGNSKYQHVPNLLNPANDSAAINLLLKSAGFDVVESGENLGINDMRRAVRDFSERTGDADIALIYYAGHGMEVGGTNYLVPVDATLRRDIDVEDETVSLDRLLQVLEPAKRLRLVILDACRDNPFVKSMKRTMASRAIGRGLARIEPTTSDTLIAFATKAGLTASDGNETHSPFTSALLKYLVTPGLDIRLSLGRVRDEVMRTTSNRQEPFVYGSLGGATVTLTSLTAGDRTEPQGNDADAPASRDYDVATKVGTKAAWDAFLAKYSTGFYAEMARAQRDKLEKLTTLSPATGSASEDKPKRVAPQAAPRTKNKPVASGNTYSRRLQCCIAIQRRLGTGRESECANAARITTGYQC